MVLQEKPTRQTVQSWTSSLQNCEKMNFCCLSCSDCGTLLRQPRPAAPCKLIHTVLAKTRPGQLTWSRPHPFPFCFLHSLAFSLSTADSRVEGLYFPWTHLLTSRQMPSSGKPGGLLSSAACIPEFFCTVYFQRTRSKILSCPIHCPKSPIHLQPFPNK